MKALLDTNIILDIALERESFFDDALMLFKLIDTKKIVAFVTATTITDIYYISRKKEGHRIAIEFITNLIDIVEIIGVNKEVILAALDSDFYDFEDAVQVSASRLNDIEVIITRNKKDFKNAPMNIRTPSEIIALY